MAPHAPTGPRLRSNERPSGAFEWQPGLAQQDRGASPRQGLLQNAGVLQKCSPGGTQHFQKLKICGHGTVLALYIFGILGKGVLLWILKSNGCQAIRLNCLTGLTLFVNASMWIICTLPKKTGSSQKLLPCMSINSKGS